MHCCSFMSQSCKELQVGRWFWLSTACLLTLCKTIDFNNVKMSIHRSHFCLGNDFFFQSKQLFTFFNRSVRLTFCAHERSHQVTLLTWVKLLLHKEKKIWKTPQDRRVVSFWWVLWVQSEATVPDHFYPYCCFQWKMQIYWQKHFTIVFLLSTNYLFKGESGENEIFCYNIFNGTFYDLKLFVALHFIFF